MRMSSPHRRAAALRSPAAVRAPAAGADLPRLAKEEEPRACFRAVGERGLSVELGTSIDEEVNARVHLLAALLRRDLASKRVEVVPTYRSLLILFDPLRIGRTALEGVVLRRLGALRGSAAPRRGRTVRVPVCYGGEFGPDLEYVAQHAGLAPQEVARLHASVTYRVHMLGFTPGFPYLGGLPQALATPRLAEPRPHIPAGSVGIAGGQTGIYPVESPGGWRLIGRTPLRLFDPQAPRPFLFSAGDRLRFEPLDPEGFHRRKASLRVRQPRPPRRSSGRTLLSVLRPGLLSTVQDQGRCGYRAFGMPVAGAMDQLSFALANLLAGNPPGAAALEMTLLGAALHFEGPAYVAVCGADMAPTLDGKPVQNGTGFPVPAGTDLAFGAAANGCRTYLAIRGGFDVPLVLGSRSTDLRAAVGGFQGRALKKGDALAVGPSRPGFPPPRTLPREIVPTPDREVALRVLLGPQDDLFLDEGLHTFFGNAYEVSNRNDRMGYQLEGPPILHRAGADIVSDALCPGAIQVPGRGTPIVMTADCQTTGGYAKIATVIGPDLGRLAQARRSDRVRFLRCSQEEAVAALCDERDLLARVAAALGEPEPGHRPTRG